MIQTITNKNKSFRLSKKAQIDIILMKAELKRKKPNFNYLFEKKGVNGRIIFAYVLARSLRAKPKVFLPYLENILIHTDDHKSSHLIVDKAIFPLLKKDHAEHLDLIVSWLKKNNEILRDENSRFKKMIGDSKINHKTIIAEMKISQDKEIDNKESEHRQYLENAEGKFKEEQAKLEA